MGAFEKKRDELREKVKNGSSTYSRSEFINLVDALTNDPEFEYDSYSKKGETYEVEKKNPTAKLRTGVKKLIKKEYGMPDAELKRIDTADFPKEMAEGMADTVTYCQKEYMLSGKTFKYPMISKDDASHKISIKQTKEDIRKTSKIVKDETTGEYKSVPTGETVKTMAHNAIVAKNTVPPWHKTKV